MNLHQVMTKIIYPKYTKYTKGPFGRFVLYHEIQ